MPRSHKDYYAILGVLHGADAKTLKRAFRKLAKQYHPDKNPGDITAEEKFKELNEAYEFLSDPQKRAAHDQSTAASDLHQNRARKPYNDGGRQNNRKASESKRSDADTTSEVFPTNTSEKIFRGTELVIVLFILILAVLFIFSITPPTKTIAIVKEKHVTSVYTVPR